MSSQKTNTDTGKYPVVKIDKNMKLRLLKACAVGEIHPEEFPELFMIYPMSIKLLSDEQLDAEIEKLEQKHKLIRN